MDAFYFLIHIYRNDVKEYGHESKGEHILTEEQFEELEQFCMQEVQKSRQANASSFSEGNADMVSVKDLVLQLRERLNITQQIHSLLFSGPDRQKTAMNMINFYNQVKKIIIRSGGVDRIINIRIFAGMIRELRIKLDITKAGLAAERTMQVINYGLDSNVTENNGKSKSYGSSSKSDSKSARKSFNKRKQRIE